VLLLRQSNPAGKPWPKDKIVDAVVVVVVPAAAAAVVDVPVAINDVKISGKPTTRALHQKKQYVFAYVQRNDTVEKH
jgi:hypothetical protein